MSWSFLGVSRWVAGWPGGPLGHRVFQGFSNEFDLESKLSSIYHSPL